MSHNPDIIISALGVSWPPRTNYTVFCAVFNNASSPYFNPSVNVILVGDFNEEVYSGEKQGSKSWASEYFKLCFTICMTHGVSTFMILAPTHCVVAYYLFELFKIMNIKGKRLYKVLNGWK